MKATALCALLLSLAVAWPVAAQTAETASHRDERTGGLAYELLHASRVTYNTARMSVSAEDPRAELMMRRLFGVYAGSRVLFDLIEDHETSRRRLEDTLLLLRAEADEAEQAVQRAQAYHSVRRSWEDTRAALSLLLQHYNVAPAREVPVAAGGTAPGEEPSDVPVPIDEPAEPEGLRARITGTDWLGGFTPDLELRGVFEGLRLVKATIQIFSDDKEVWTDKEDRLTGQIRKATENWPKHLEMRVDWRIRIDDDELVSGDNRIVITLHNEAGETVSAETTVRKRLF